MKKVLTVDDVWHGMIGVANSIPDAIKGLIQENYLNDNTEIQLNNFPKIIDYLGTNWVEALSHMTANDLNILFEDYLKFKWVIFWEY